TALCAVGELPLIHCLGFGLGVCRVPLRDLAGDGVAVLQESRAKHRKVPQRIIVIGTARITGVAHETTLLKDWPRVEWNVATRDNASGEIARSGEFGKYGIGSTDEIVLAAWFNHRGRGRRCRSRRSFVWRDPTQHRQRCREIIQRALFDQLYLSRRIVFMVQRTRYSKDTCDVGGQPGVRQYALLDHKASQPFGVRPPLARGQGRIRYPVDVKPAASLDDGTRLRHATFLPELTDGRPCVLQRLVGGPRLSGIGGAPRGGAGFAVHVYPDRLHSRRIGGFSYGLRVPLSVLGALALLRHAHPSVLERQRESFGPRVPVDE